MDVKICLEEFERMGISWLQKKPTGNESFVDGFELARNILAQDLLNLVEKLSIRYGNKNSDENC